MVMLFNVTTVLLPGVTGLTEKVTLVPAGTPAVAARLIGVEKPSTLVVCRVMAAEALPQATAVPAFGTNSNVGLLATIVKFTSDIS